MKKYVFKPYSKIFPELFDKEKARIISRISMPLAIEHIGSTAIPGLGGKGIIDIIIAVSKANMDSASKQLQDLGYEYRPTFSTPDRFYFIIYLPDPEEENRRYHIHLTYPENNEWKELIYGSLLRKLECPFFRENNIPEINAIWIDENHRRQGFGKVLIKWLEDLAN